MTDDLPETASVIEKLFESRIVFLSGDVDDAVAKDIVARLITLDFQNPAKDILLYIDSWGGDVYSFLSIHDAMKMLRCDVATVAVGKAFSCAAMILLSGTKGKRFTTPNSRIMTAV